MIDNREYIYILKSHIKDGSEVTNKPDFFMENDSKWINDGIDIEITKELIQELAHKLSSVFKDRPIDNTFGLINTKFKRGIEIQEFKVREKDVSKNKVGSIIRGTFAQNDQLINDITKELNIKYISKAIDDNKQATKLNIDKNENENGIKTFTFLKENDKASVTGALPTLVEMLVRHRNDTNTNNVSFLNVEMFDLFRKYKEKSAIKNW